MRRGNSISGVWMSPVTVRMLLQILSRSSYALFLTHFSIVLLANVLWVQAAWSMAGAAAWLTAGAWLACVAIALLFERFVERPLSAIRLPA